MSAGEEASYGEKNKYRILDPAIVYLKEHLYDCELRVGELHRLCGVSDTYFRKIFRSRFGASPHSYVLSRRIRHAEAILSSGDFRTIEEVALAVGFQDPLYFSKVFKKACGVSPSVFANP